MRASDAIKKFSYLNLASALLALSLFGCAHPGEISQTGKASQKQAPAVVNVQVPKSLASLSFDYLHTGGSQKWSFKKDGPQILAEGTLTHFKAFKLPAGNSPLKVKVESYSSFEVPHYPVKYMFCPRVLLLDANYKIVFSSDFDDLIKRQRLFGEPRFIFEHTLPTGKSKPTYLLVIRERDFDGHFVKSIQPDDAPIYDELLRRERERIYSSSTGPVRISLKN